MGPSESDNDDDDDDGNNNSGGGSFVHLLNKTLAARHVSNQTECKMHKENGKENLLNAAET